MVKVMVMEKEHNSSNILYDLLKSRRDRLVHKSTHFFHIFKYSTRTRNKSIVGYLLTNSGLIAS